ncbi:hypothetical protein [Mesorhizobium sp. YM1C-6-2]|jgi:hypothetical protein|uniref:hypothetical protein n=1 Tax=Mesorhizobium sp. YM1C-6-2 TaxID=1827501 RepID=UPI000EF18FD3|nr:hypothetical protein [Mesorhizobium sp. YM1C-6-2]RLP24976.1 hypothetical protein D8676_15980 [Mesorhizobium sp. YM1C-6-2]
MGMILTGMVVAIAIAFGAGYFLLDVQQQKPAWQVYSTDSTRVGDPGHNLVGQNWSGDPGNNATDSGTETSS